MQNGRSTGALCFQQIPSGFLVVGYTCFLFNCHEAGSPSLSVSAFLLFLPPHIPLFSSLSHFQRWAFSHVLFMSDMLVLHTTYQQPCCAPLRGSQLCQPVICLHTEQPAHSSPQQLHSSPEMALSLTRGWL